MENLIFLVPLLPFAGFLVNGLIGKRLPRRVVSALGCAGPAVAFVVAGVLFFEIRRADSSDFALSQSLWTWIEVGDLKVAFRFTFDRLSGIMALVVTGVGTLIHVY